MDQVSFFTHLAYTENPGFTWPSWGIRVNGEDLRLIAVEATRDLKLMQMPDGFDDDDWNWRHVLRQHAGLRVSAMAPPSRLLFGEPDEDHRQTHGLWQGRVPLLCHGGCGQWECWPLLAVIEADEQVVTWSSFVQPYRERWGELTIGPYTFDRIAYAEALANPEALEADPAAAWLSRDDDL